MAERIFGGALVGCSIVLGGSNPVLVIDRIPPSFTPCCVGLERSAWHRTDRIVAALRGGLHRCDGGSPRAKRPIGL
jgi:hypothetical protein